MYNLENMILVDVIPYEQTFTLLDDGGLIATHTTLDLLIIIIIAIPLTYFIITVIKKLRGRSQNGFMELRVKLFLVLMLFY